jgi:hypothetical protein
VPVAERWALGLEAPLATLTARDDGQAQQNAVLGQHLARWLEASEARRGTRG